MVAMMRLAARSFAHHRTSAVATGLVAAAGTALVTAMAGLLGTGLSAGGDRDFLVRFPLILGGWVLAIVLFAMISTIAVALHGRTNEIAGIRLIGATPSQIRRMVAGETAIVASIAAVPGLIGGQLLGAGLLAGIRRAGLVDEATGYSPGAALPSVATVLMLGAAVAAAWLGSRTIAARSPIDDPTPARMRGGATRIRRIAAGAALAAGLGSSTAVLAVDADDILTTALTGPACVLAAVGSGLLAPELIRAAHRVIAKAPVLRSGPAGHLIARNLATAPERLRPAVTFLTLFIGVAAGTLSMQSIENRHGAAGTDGELMATINYLVVFLIAAFMVIALSNNLIAAIARRHPEFATMHLIGATASQSQRMLVGEAAAAVIISAVTGAFGAFVTTVPFAIVKTGDPLAAFAPLPYALAVVLGAGTTVGVTAAAGRRAVRAAAA
nr:FtsX-like permease family protein [Nocardia sp. GTS18]